MAESDRRRHPFEVTADRLAHHIETHPNHFAAARYEITQILLLLTRYGDEE